MMNDAMRFCAWCICGFAVLFAGSGLLLSPSRAGAQAPQPAPTLRVTSRLVYVDVVVRDSAGRIVHGLKESDFHLSENKRPQSAVFFEEHTSPSRAPASPVAPAPPGAVLNVSPGVKDETLNLVLFDFLNTDERDQVYARERMIQFLRKLPPGKQVALFVLGDRLTMVQGVTRDSAALAKAAEGIDLKQLNRTRPAGEKLQEADDEERILEANPDAGRLAQAMHMEIGREERQNMKARLGTTGEAFRELAAAVNGYPGRKNLFWLAGQFPSPEYFRFQELATQPADSSIGLRTGDSRLQGTAGDESLGLALNAGADAAIADSQIAVYPISTTGVETDSIDASQTGLGSAGPDHLTDTAMAQFSDRATLRSVMQHIADQTGGEPFYGNNDVAQMLRRGFEDGENFYTLAYAPTDRNWNGQYRTINVGLNGGSGSLSYRRGYVALPDKPAGDLQHEFQQAMRISSPPSTMLRLTVQPGADGKSVLVESTLQLDGIGFGSDGDKRSAHLLLGLMAYPYPPDGNAPPLETSGKLNLDLTPEQFAALRASGVQVRQELPLKSGQYLLRVGVLDTGSGRIGTLTLPVKMP